MKLEDWQQIEKIALIGVDHLSISEALMQQLQAFGIATEDNTEVQSLLEAVAYHAQVQKTSMPLKDISSVSSPQFPSFSPVKYLPFPLVHLLFHILEKHPTALQEFVYLSQQKNYYIPAEYIPPLLPYLEHRHNHAQWHSVYLLLEAQSKWLLKQNPEWHHFLKRKGEARLWNPEEVALATKEVKRFQSELNERLTYLENLNWQRIKDWTYKVDMSQYDLLRRDWESSVTQSSTWGNRIFQLFGILDFRKKMQTLFEVNQ